MMGKKIKSAKFKRGFTLIELIVVVIVIGILALLAIPKFMGQIDKAKETHIINDVRVVESKVGEYLIKHGDLTKWGAPIGALDGDELYNKRGLIDSDNPITEGPFRIVPEEVLEEVKSHLDGTFYSNDLGEAYYSKEEFIGSPSYTDEEINDKIKLGYIPIATAEDLNSIRNATPRIYGEGTDWEDEYTGGLDKQYVQVLDVDLSKYSKEGWSPIGTFITRDNNEGFKGIYDGGNYVITGLEVKVDDENYQGLFGFTEGATIRNVGLIDNKLTDTGTDSIGIGGLVGRADRSTIENSYSTGSITGIDFLGGLVGWAYDSTKIANSYSTVSVTGDSRLGGLVGYADDEVIIENSYATGKVTGADNYVGGLVGDADNSTIENSYATGSVTSEEDVGGLVGIIWGSTIENSYATGEVTGSTSVGGLVGGAWYSTATITNSYATGAVTGTGTYSYAVGGLVGYADRSANISNSYATGSVIGEDHVGGFVGGAWGSANISNSYATGSVKGSGEYAGGLVGGAYESTIENSYATGPVTGEGSVGGLVGQVKQSNINNSYATASVKSSGDKVGGLVGDAENTNTVSNSYATGSVEGVRQVGGLVGGISYDSTIDKSYATGLVKGSGDYVGGLVGDSGDYEGGFWGIPLERNDGSSIITRSYWDTQTTNQEESDGGIGLSTEEMKLKGTYEGWDFESVWKIEEDNDYPKLR